MRSFGSLSHVRPSRPFGRARARIQPVSQGAPFSLRAQPQDLRRTTTDRDTQDSRTRNTHVFLRLSNYQTVELYPGRTVSVILSLR